MRLPKASEINSNNRAKQTAYEKIITNIEAYSDIEETDSDNDGSRVFYHEYSDNITLWIRVPLEAKTIETALTINNYIEMSKKSKEDIAILCNSLNGAYILGTWCYDDNGDIQVLYIHHIGEYDNLSEEDIDTILFGVPNMVSLAEESLGIDIPI